MDNRIRLMAIVLGFGFFVLILRLSFWQVVKGQELSRFARSQYVTSEQISTSRGSILAADLAPLATSRTTWQIWADPGKLERNPTEIAKKLAPILADEKEVASKEAKLVQSLARPNTRWVALSDKVSDEGKRAVENLKIAGVGWNIVDTRFYPEGTMSAQLLGFVGQDEQGERGYFGLEGFYDVTLSGKQGIRRQEEDLRGNPIPFGLFAQILPTPGLDLVTFIDRSVQFIVERHLRTGVEKYGARSGNVIIMKPTGEILALASFPSYEPVNYNQTDPNLFKNPAVADSFEPGSVFKILVMSAALDSGVVTSDTKCDECVGPVKIDKYAIHTWNDKYYPDATMKEVIVHSDNVGMAFVGKRLGQERLWDYLDRFGIGHLTGVDLQEEASPALRENGRWSMVDVATASFGQGVAVTSIQLIRAAAAIANGGILPVPRVVDKIKSDSWEQTIPAKDEGRVINEETAAKITEMMVEAVRSGEAKWAQPVGFRIAGKTGTAQIPIAGHYDPEKTMASFVGFAPADKPKFVMLVTLREPTSSPWASETAAPLWFSIVKDLFPYFGIGPSQ